MSKDDIIFVDVVDDDDDYGNGVYKFVKQYKGISILDGAEEPGYHMMDLYELESRTMYDYHDISLNVLFSPDNKEEAIEIIEKVIAVYKATSDYRNDIKYLCFYRNCVSIRSEDDPIDGVPKW